MRDLDALRTDRLKALREKRGWSQRELARLCGLGEAQIGKYESGQTDPTVTSLKTIADKLDVSADYLLGISDDPRRHIDASALSDEEYQMLRIFRRDGWTGVIRLGAEKIGK
jgi:transcriptional regulator with XRE-family HTH domain